MPSSQEIARVMAEMDRFNQSAKVTVTEERYEKRVASVGGSYGGLTALLQQGAPGNWASDHKSEAEKFAGWHYVAISSIGKAIRSANCEAYQEQVREYAKAYNEQDDDTTPLPKWHPLMKLLKRPNPSQSGASFREEVAIQLCLTGSALIWNVPNQMGRTVERYVIPTAIAEPRQPERGRPKGGWYINPEVARWQIESGWFLYTGLATAIGKVIDARDVQVIRFIHPVFKDEGQSPVSAGALWTDTSEKVDISRHSHLRNGSDPSVIIGIDGVEDEGTLQRMSAKFNEKYAGPSKHGKAMFVNGQNVKIEPVTRTPAEMAYEGAFVQFRDAIMALHGVTPIAAGIEAPSGDDGLYAPLKQFISGTVQPILDLMAEEDTEQLAGQFGEGISVLYTAKAVDDAKLTEQQINTDIAAGAIEVDEIRKLRGRKPWGGEKGKAVAGQGAKEEPKPGLPGLNQGVPGLETNPNGLEPQTGSQALDPSKPPQGTPDPMKLAEEAVAKALGGFADRLSALLKSGDNCGTGAGGFKPGNDCARGGGESSDAPEKKKRGKKAGKSEPKEFWEMTPGEFRRANNQALVDALTETSSYGAMRYVKPGELRVGENGQLEIKRVPPGGKLKDKPTWNRLSDGEEEILREKLGVESRDHEAEIEQAIQSGKPVPKEVTEYYPKNDLIYEHFSSKPSSSPRRANESGGSGNKFTYFIDIGKERDITEEVLDYVNSIHKLPASDRDDLASELFDKLPILRSDYDKLTEEAANIDPKYGKWMESRVELQRERDRESDAAREAYLQELRDSVNKPKRRTRKKSFFKSSDCGANAEGGGGFQPGNTCGRGDGSGDSGGEDEYRGSHKAPGRDGGAPLDDMTGGGEVYPDDIYSDKAASYYRTGEPAMDRKSIKIIQSLRGKPDAEVTIYRAVPSDVEGGINPGDWVTINRDYAVMHGEGPLRGDYRILELKVRAGDVYGSGDSIHEYGYDPAPKKKSLGKSGSSCGANAQGGGGFQPGNTCGKRDGKGGESSEGGGKGASVNPKILAWAREKFGDDTTAENFAKWFGDSKVVDEEGNPLVVYHGAEDYRSEVDGIFVTDDPEMATRYAELKAIEQAVSENSELEEIVYEVMADEGADTLTDFGPERVREIADANGFDIPKSEGKVDSLWVRSENPLDLREHGSDVGDVGELWDSMHSAGLLDESWDSLDDEARYEVESQYNGKALYNFLEDEGIQAKAFERGYDSVVFVDIAPDGGATHDSWLVKQGDQVKSDRNSGKFSRDSKDVTKSAASDSYNPPESARNNARKVLRWKEQHGDAVRGMTATGWTRANQLASGEKLSRETVGRMAAFARHRKNSKVDPKFRDEPWRDAGYVAWLGWGGDSGINWAAGVIAGEGKSGSGCGANTEGGGGFQPGNTCGREDGAEGEGSGEKGKANQKVLAWARKKFGSDEVAENFARWFGDSKVVDEDGNPLTVYHGTNAAFTEFDENRQGATDDGYLGSGFYFAPDKEWASGYGDNVIDAHLSIQNPLTIPWSTSWGHDSIYDVRDALAELPDMPEGLKTDREVPEGYKLYEQELEDGDWGYNPNGNNKRFYVGPTEALYGTDKEIYGKKTGSALSAIVQFNDELKGVGFADVDASGLFKDVGRDKIKAALIKSGRDGIITFDPDTKQVGEVLAFKSKQIKSASKNSGKFDPDSGDITKAAPSPKQSRKKSATKPAKGGTMRRKKGS